MQKILLTGAAGGIGTAFYQARADLYQFRLADRTTQNIEVRSPDHEVLKFDIADLAACQQACRDVDVVVHLAADPSPSADFHASLLNNNIVGTYNIFQAAKDQGCRRVVYASSVQAVEGYPVDVQARADMPVRPQNMYGATKCFGEAVGSVFAKQGLSVIAVRIGAFDAVKAGQPNTARNISAYVSPRDLVDLLDRCIQVADVGYAIAHGVSNNRFKRLDLTHTQALLGYQPQDDGFELTGYDLRG